MRHVHVFGSKLICLALAHCVLGGVGSNSPRANSTLLPTVAACSEDVLEGERLLRNQGFLPGPLDGCLDEATDFAVVAYRRAYRLRTDEGFTPTLLERLRKPRLLRPRATGEAHLEVDLLRKVMYWVNESGLAQHILPISIGSGISFKLGGRHLLAITPRGTFTVYRKIEGWHKSPLGMMYYSSYIKGGVAIHGRTDFSTHAQTFGCIAIPNFAAVQVFDMAPIGTKVIVFGPGRSSQAKKRMPKLPSRPRS